MSGSSGVSTTTVQNIPEEFEVYFHRYLARAKALFREKEIFDYYDGQTYADQNDNEKDGIANLATRGRYSDTLITKGKTHIESVLDGDFLGGDTDDFKDIIDDVINKPKRTFHMELIPKIGGSLYYVNNLSGINESKRLIDDSKYYSRMEDILYIDNYRSERISQERALSLGVEYGRQAVIDAEILRMAGLYQREYNQGALEDAYKVYYEEQTSALRRLDVLGNAVRAVVGTQVAIDRPYYRPSPAMGTMGGAMSGAASGAMIGSMYGSPGYGTIIGAAVGAILGYLSTQ